MSRPEIDYDELFVAVDRDRNDPAALSTYVSDLVDQAYEAGRQDILTEGPVRVAMLDGQTYWLDQAEKADGAVGRVVAETVATAFAAEADKYRTTQRPTLTALTDPNNVQLTEVPTGRHASRTGIFRDTEDDATSVIYIVDDQL